MKLEIFGKKMLENKIPPFIVEKFLRDYLNHFNETDRPLHQWLIILDTWMGIIKEELEKILLEEFDSPTKH